MIELTNITIQLVEKLFLKNEVLEAIELLKLDCADDLPLLHEKIFLDGNERIRFAAIKFSDGNLDKLYYAVDLAQKDWRDLLLFSGFGNDAEAHKVWAAKILNK